MNLKTLSEFFEETVENITGFPLKDLDEKKGQVLQSTSHVEQKSYTDSRGTKAVEVVTTLPSGKKEVEYTVNGRRIISLPEDIIQNMTLDFEEDKSIGEPLEDLPYPLTIGTEFPKVDVYLIPGESLRIDADVSGIDPERITVSFAKEYLGIHIDEIPTSSDAGIYLVKALNNSCKEYSKEIYIDTNKFDIKNLEYMIKNGRLCIHVPRKDIADSRIVFKPKGTPKVKNPKRRLNEDVVTETLD